MTEQSNFFNPKVLNRHFFPRLAVFPVVCTVCLLLVSSVCAAAWLTLGCASLAAGPPPVQARSRTHRTDCPLRRAGRFPGPGGSEQPLTGVTEATAGGGSRPLFSHTHTLTHSPPHSSTSSSHPPSSRKSFELFFVVFFVPLTIPGWVDLVPRGVWGLTRLPVSLGLSVKSLAPVGVGEH